MQPSGFYLLLSLRFNSCDIQGHCDHATRFTILRRMGTTNDYYKDDEVSQAQYLSIPASAVWYLTDGNKDQTVNIVVKIYN
jgi:hypothetical protein